MGRCSGMIPALTKAVPYYVEEIRNHIIITKPGIVFLVLITTFVGMYTGAKGLPGISVTLFTLSGVGLAAGGAATLNNLLDRFIDSLMERTRNRPLPSGKVHPSSAMLLGVSLSILSIMTFVIFVNILTALLTLLAIVIYIFPYTLLLKRKTALATLIGSITGALPPVIGYVAIKGFIGQEALLLFLIMYIWQHPHFWSLAMKCRDDYARAGIPVLPVSAGVSVTKIMVFVSVLMLFTISLLPFLSGLSGRFYLLTAIILGTIYVLLSLIFLFSGKEYSKPLFYYSLIYLSLLFLSMTLNLEVH